MKALNPIEKSLYIDHKYKEYLKSSFKFGNSSLQELFNKQLEKEELFKGPFVSLDLPFERGKTINQLIAEGKLCKSFGLLSNIEIDRPLYKHQEEALDIISSGNSTVVTTGTGSGKTECFLYPILNELLTDYENGNRDIGIRSIFLYPMNALVNDQIDRIRKILSSCPNITYGFFTGDTPEETTDHDRKKLAKEIGVEIPVNELTSRTEIRKNPPHLLFTNYSMLEYLLIRPNDYAIFDPNRLGNWKFVVLDEAHSYNGSLGIEISLLMRRLTAYAEKKPRFILTSATLGTQGKSEGDIVNFAKNLTSCSFNTSDIVFSKRIKFDSHASLYKVKGSDYLELKQRLASDIPLVDICEKYKETHASKNEEILYDLLSNDENTHTIYNCLKDKSKNYASLKFELRELEEAELLALIDLINGASKNGVNLFDLKYHSFVRPLSGAFITFGSDQKLSLTKTNAIDNKKTFEIGNCRYCDSTYIVGKIQQNRLDGLDYLYQNQEVDVYENYGDNERAKVDYFMLEEMVNEDIDSTIDETILEEYTLCNKCGSIHRTGNLNAKKCDCDSLCKFSVYKIRNDDKKEASSFNNISQCLYCGHKGTSGVVKLLNVGKDEGTAIISQILYETLDGDDAKHEKRRKFSLRISTEPIKQIPVVKPKVKQYLAFSDSRQQASFFAAFVDSNHTRMLRKRLIWNILEETNYKEMSVNQLVSKLEDKIESQRLFDNDLSSEKNAWVSLLIDLLKVDGAHDGEGLGLYYFELDTSSIFDEIDDDIIKDELGQYNINTKNELNTLIQVVATVFKTTPAIKYVQSTLSQEEKEKYLEYRRFNNFVMLKAQKNKLNIRSLLPIVGEENKIVRYVKKACNCNTEGAVKILDMVFNVLSVSDSIDSQDALFIKHNKEDAYQIDASKFKIKNYVESPFYRCNKCSKLTPFNLNNACPSDKCKGKLYKIDPDDALSENYYRKEYKSKKIERMVIQEHTAQLDRKVSKEFQKRFVDKKINILSCSTTFEMGIDIGDLETVFMRNVPPTPANYVQRAGRAGRRSDSSAYILTYCSSSSHDYTYFAAPEKMISGVINPPYFKVDNEKIISRHLLASCLGFFFRQHPDYFISTDSFIFNNGSEVFIDYLKSEPSDLRRYIDEKVVPETRYRNFHKFKWLAEIDYNDEKLTHFIDSIKEMAVEFKDAENASKAENDYEQADYFKGQEEKLHNQSVIEMLSKYCVIPKYGFPVDLVDLQILENDEKRKNDIDLTRDLKIAISEYAPDSEVLVMKNKYVSKYITLPKTTEMFKNYFETCSQCHKINVYTRKTESIKCKYCGGEIRTGTHEYFIQPTLGFKANKSSDSPHLKPKRSYVGEVSYLGGGIFDKMNEYIGTAITVQTSTNDELLVLNRSGFYMCDKCGYSEKITIGSGLPFISKKHKNFREYDCFNEKLIRLRLGHKFQTDVARLTIPSLHSNETESNHRALSFLYAFLEGMSYALEIERNDLDGVLELNLEQKSYDIIVFDNVPGGAGHVKRLLSKEAVISSLKAALDKVSQQCCDEDTSCYSCLRSYYNQTYHSKLKRKFAIDSINQLLNDAEFNVQLVNNALSKESKRMTNLTFGSDGRNPGEETAEEIWNNIYEDCYDENELSMINLLKENSNIIISRPYYRTTLMCRETGEAYFSNLAWKDEKVLLFLNENEDEYRRASEQTDWSCYCTAEEFDVFEFLSRIGGLTDGNHVSK